MLLSSVDVACYYSEGLEELQYRLMPPQFLDGSCYYSDGSEELQCTLMALYSLGVSCYSLLCTIEDLLMSGSACTLVLVRVKA